MQEAPVYEPNPTHEPGRSPSDRGSRCPRDVDASARLAGSEQVGSRRFATDGDRAFSHRMTVMWERFAGRTDRFAIRLSLIADPDDGEGALPEDAASWGSLQLWAENRNLCSHIDQGEALTSVHWYLLPFAEWLADHWNALLHGWWAQVIPRLQG